VQVLPLSALLFVGMDIETEWSNVMITIQLLTMDAVLFAMKSLAISAILLQIQVIVHRTVPMG